MLISTALLNRIIRHRNIVFGVLLLSFFSFTSGLTAIAQLSSKYTFSYVGTNANVYNVAPMTTLQATGTVGNDAVFASQAIGFTFKYNCVDYTTIGISANGFIWFGTGSCATNQYTPLSSTAGETGVVAGIISCFGANLVPHGSGTRTLTTKLAGTAPNRIFTIEWRKCCMTGATTNPVDLQIKLFETTNGIEIRLFDYSYLLSGTTAVGQVGMRAATTDFVNRTTSGVNFCTSVAGAVNTATCSIVPTAVCNYASSASNQAITYIYAFTGSCCTTPATQASAASISGLSYTSATINWTGGSGTGGDIVFLKQGSAIATDPANNTSYTANPVFGTGSQIGATGAYAVFSGFGGTVPVTNLLPGTTYYYSIYSFDAVGPCYKSPTVTTGSFTTLMCGPTIQASLPALSCVYNTTMNLSFTRGNGTRAIVVGRAGSNVNADPAYNTSYTANPIFGSGSQIGVGNYVVYDGNDAGLVTVQLTGLTPGTTYYFKIYEYDGPPNCYGSAVSINGIAHGGVYVSSTTTQNAANVLAGALAQDIIKLTVVVTGDMVQAAFMNSITFTTTGTTNTATDLTNAKIFYTGTSNAFSNATQFGTTFTAYAGALTANGRFALSPGNNYFWIAYDVKSTATNGNVLDATVTSFNLTDHNGTNNYAPTPAAPAGSRLIAVPAGLVFCSGVIPEACCNGTGCNYSCCQGETLLGITLTGSTVMSFSGWPCNGAGGNDKFSYTDMFLSNVYSLNQGSTSSMSINFDTWFSMDMWWVLWVDWSQNGVFTEGSPERYPATGSIDQWTSQNITVPASVSSGRHRARLWVQEFSYKPTTACRITHGPLTTSLGYIVDFNIYVPDGSLVDLDPVSAPGGVSCATLAPGVATPIVYNLNDVASPLTATGTELLWYTTPTGGVGSVVAPTPSTNTPGTTTYYVSQTNTSGSPLCAGPRTQIAVIVNLPLLPGAPAGIVTQPDCALATGSVQLTGLPATGTWTINPNGITGSGTTNTISPLAPGTYNYTITNFFGCISPALTNVVINPQPVTPTAPVIGTVTQPAGAVTTGSVVLTNLPADGWIVDPGGIVGAAGVTTLTISGLAPGTYTFTVTSTAGCVSIQSLPVDIVSLPLPIELLTFTADCDGDYLKFIWATASETNNDFFTLERSPDATYWESMGVIDGAGNTNNVRHYSFMNDQSSSVSAYYRLKQTDWDGKFSHSNIIFAEACTAHPPTLTILPNPSKGIFFIRFDGDMREIQCVEVYSAFGEKIYHSDIFLPELDLSYLTPGIYVLHLNLASEVMIAKIVVEE